MTYTMSQFFEDLPTFRAIKPTHLGELFTIIQATILGTACPFERDRRLKIRLENYTSDVVTGIITDPFDGREYRLALVPIERELKLGEWRSPVAKKVRDLAEAGHRMKAAAE